MNFCLKILIIFRQLNCSQNFKNSKFRRKLLEKVQDLTDVNEAANAKIMSLEKTRHKLMGDLDDAQVIFALIW